MFGRKKSDRGLRQALPALLPRIWRFALALSGNPDTADELVQATCLRAIEKAEQFRTGTNPLPWLLTICRSIWLNQLRAARIRANQSLDASPDLQIADPGADTETNIFARQVFSKVMELPEAQRETVVLVYVEGFSYREAAAILDIPVGTVMSRLASARGKLSVFAALPEAKMKDTVR
ncbi:RNA polymerase sigma factor [Thalassococcus sp. S3]|uniref:RNA polymerase sigma factor n=1 Tax=Thalassococcus sp. S3 TaxID=2017482 RepID=UPI00102480FE|nr:RNA polymerase sigma factor [Thalassococcus sp. S3]QBF33687.1 RNA polymerase subunit sigma [Thalassococcus sp. S3]